MPISIQKQKTATKPTKLPKVEIVDPATLELEELADEYGKAEDEVNALKANPAFVRLAELQKELVARIKEHYEPTQAIQIKGEHYLLEIGKASKAPAEITDINKVRTMMGEKTFMACAKINITDLRAYLTPEQCAKVLTPEDEIEYTDRRKVVAKYLG